MDICNAPCLSHSNTPGTDFFISFEGYGYITISDQYNTNIMIYENKSVFSSCFNMPYFENEWMIE